MSDNIPFDIQVQIIKRLPVKSLLQFRSVSKSWKSLIDGSPFISRYSGQQQHLLVSYCGPVKRTFASIVDDDTFPSNKVSLPTPQLVKNLKSSTIIGSSHGLLCLSGIYRGCYKFVIWNLSVRKAVVVAAVPKVSKLECRPVLGFGVCGETIDPKIVMVTHTDTRWDENVISCIPWRVEVFTLSTGVWRSPKGNLDLPRKSISLVNCIREGLAVSGVLYWLATDRITNTMDGEFRCIYNLLISFDITSEEFREINFPDTLAHREPRFQLSMAKLRESLVVLRRGLESYYEVFGVWMMEDDVSKSFTKIFTISIPNATIFGVLEFRKNGEPIVEILENYCDPLEDDASLVVYEPYSKKISYLGITGGMCTFSSYSYMETLLLLDQQDLTT